MYERFTIYAREVVERAHAEARRLGHEYLGPEHMLFGLASGGDDVASRQVLMEHGAQEIAIREEIVKLVDPAGMIDLPGKLPLTPMAKNIVEFAIQEADRYRSKHVGTIHLLLGLLRPPVGSVAQVLLMNLGVSLEKLRRAAMCRVDGSSSNEWEKRAT